MRIEPYKEGEGTTDPFSRPFIDNYVSENEAKIYLTREDIIELGFLRTNPERKLFKHKDKEDLYLLQTTHYNFAVKDLAEETTEIWSSRQLGSIPTLLYQSTKPSKEDIQQVINNYAA